MDEVAGLRKRIAELEAAEAERQEAEAALRESEEVRVSLLDNSPAAVLVANEDSSIRYVNRALEERTGFSAAELVGVKAPYPFWPEEGRAETEKALRKAMVQGAYNVEMQFQRKSGERFWAEISATPVVREGKYLYYLSNWVDITERKKAAQALEKSREFLDSLIASMQDGFSVLDPNGVHIHVNPAFCRMTGFSREDLVGSGPPHPYWPPEEYETIGKAFEKTLKGEFRTFEFAFMRKNGERFPVLVSPSSTRDKQGNVVSYHATVKDITERKKAEEALKNSHEELRRLATQLQLVREKERAAVAGELHDEVGQALAALQIDLHWLERRLSRDDTELLEKAKSMSRLIQSNTERLRRLYMELRPGMLDDLGLGPTIEWQADEFRKRTGIKSVLSLDRDAGPRGAGCSLAVYRVFQEALDNVARHAEATEVNIRLTKRDNGIVLEIADNGRGITKKQVSAPGSSGIVGMRERLRPCGGKVEITGVRGKGTTVRVSIPVGNGEQA